MPDVKPLYYMLIAFCAIALVFLGGKTNADEAKFKGDNRLTVKDRSGSVIGEIEVNPLGRDGSLRLAFVRKPEIRNDRRFEWWQLAEREDRPGYPRVDPQSGGSGLPGAKGEDEDPAYYSESDFNNPVLAPLIFEDGKFWLLDRPTHDSGFRFESWLIERTGPKSATKLAGIHWGITVRDGKLMFLHQPTPIIQKSRFDWHESLRISGFGVGWEITAAYRFDLP